MILSPLSSLFLAASLATVPFALAQVQSDQSATRPLPDVPTLMHEVEQHQRASEAIQKDYLYHEVATVQDNDKKTETREYDVFWLNGVEVHKLTRKNGRNLTDDEKKKENERIDKEVAKAQERKSKAQAKGQETDSHGHEEITVSRFLSLGSFANPRRVQLVGRDTIAIDYIGDPKAKTRNRSEDFVRNLAGTIWVDEEDRTITRLEGHFVNSFKIGAGLVMNIKKDTSFLVEQRKINGEVWLPSRIEGQGAARVMLFVSLNGSIHITDSDYRKFKATSTILPGVATVNDPSAPESTTPQPVGATSAAPQ
ncbi:hypothetical protein [Edaphobacter aggregans]|uniref:hypothetical protein n=1 Tax=Edaphobacter aggregans TaxID=570835 RepID=UPI0005540F2A|nr:hypothetical protein [Edaphobacter aggregans]